MDAKPTKHDGGGVSQPEDIVFEVLARLPEKALCRFRCVCKGWRALISDPAFVAAQRSHAANPHLVGVFMGSKYGPEVRLMDMDGKVVKAFEIRSSTPLPPQLTMRPDLICANGSGLTGHGGIIIDPAAGEAFTAFGTNHADASAMSYSTILGRATRSGLFKALRLEEPILRDDNDDGGQQQLCEVATIMDGSGCGAAKSLTWRQMSSAPPFVITGLICEDRAIVNGVIYFIHGLDINGDVSEDEDAVLNFHIVAFDLESEEWKPEVINGPASEHKEGWSIALVELNGSLTFVHKVLVNGHPYTSIWRLVDPDKSVWVKEYMIPMRKNQIETAKPLGAMVDGRLLLWSIVLDNEKTSQNNAVCSRYRQVVQFYNPSTKVSTDFMEMAKLFKTLVLYTGSLLS